MQQWSMIQFSCSAETESECTGAVKSHKITVELGCLTICDRLGRTLMGLREKRTLFE